MSEILILLAPSAVAIIVAITSAVMSVIINNRTMKSERQKIIIKAKLDAYSNLMRIFCKINLGLLENTNEVAYAVFEAMLYTPPEMEKELTELRRLASRTLISKSELEKNGIDVGNYGQWKLKLKVQTATVMDLLKKDLQTADKPDESLRIEIIE